jgi:membrane protein
MADDVTRRVITFVDNVHVGVLGAVGLVVLLYTSMSVGRKVEQAANQIWHVTRARSIGQSIASYLTVVVAGPILLFSALALTASMMSSAIVQDLATYQPLGWLIELLAGALPYGFVLVGCTLVYWLVPNTRVSIVAAIIGGAVAAFAWILAGRAFALFVAGSTSYTAIYSAFASLILLLLWLNVNWLILLAGCAVAFYVQHPRAAVAGGAPGLDGRLPERLGFMVMQAVGAAAYRGEPLAATDLERRLGVPPDALAATLERLERAGLIVRSDARPARIVPGRPLEATALKAVWDAMRAEAVAAGAVGPSTAPVAGCEARIDAAVTEALAPWTLKDLALAEPAGESGRNREDADDRRSG